MKTNENNIIFKINNDKTLKNIFEITIDKLETIIFLLSNNCIFYIELFDHQTGQFFDDLLKIHPNINLKIDITDYFLQLYGVDDKQLNYEAEKFDHFFELLMKKTEKEIQLNISTNQISMNRKDEDIFFEFLNGNVNNSLNIDESVLISQKIQMSSTIKRNNLLIMFATFIANAFANLLTKKISDTPLSHTKNLIDNLDQKKFAKWNILVNNEPINSLEQPISYSESVKTLSLNGNDNTQCLIISMNGFHHEYKHINFLAGIFDDQFSLFICNETLQQNCSTISEDFVAFMSEFFVENQDQQNHASKDLRILYDSFEIDFVHQNYLISNVHSDHQLKNMKMIFSFRNKKNTKSNRNFRTNTHSSKQTLLLQKIQKKCEIEKNSEIFHQNRDVILEKDEEFQIKKLCYCKKLPISNSDNNFYQFEISKSHFHLIISRFIECISMNNHESSIFKKIENHISYFSISHCHIRFLTRDLILFDEINFIHCIFETSITLFSDKIFNKMYDIHILYSVFRKSIFINNFAEIKSDQLPCFLSFTEFDNFLNIKNCIIKIKEDLPRIFMHLEMINCTILAKNKIFRVKSDSTLQDFVDQTIPLNMLKYMNAKLGNLNDECEFLIRNSIILGDFLISGVFKHIKIIQSKSSFIIDAYYKSVKIKNHTGIFSVLPVIKEVQPSQPINKFYEDDSHLILENLIVGCIENSHIENLVITNCQIGKIRNLQCRNLKITDSKCKFHIITTENILDCTDEVINIEKFEQNYMILQNFD